MGGWIMLLAALARPERVAGLVGIAAAPDFTEDLIWARATAEQRQALESLGYVDNPSAYSATRYRITRRLIEEGRRHLLLEGPIPLACPVRLIHGLEDADVPKSEEHTSELQSLMRISYAVFCLKKKNKHHIRHTQQHK